MKSADQWGQDVDNRPVFALVKAIAIGAIIVLVLVALTGLVTTGSIFFKGEAAKKTVGARTNVQVYSPENKIAQIAFFHNTCQDVNKQLRIVENNQARLTTDEHAAQFATDVIRQHQAEDSLINDQQDITGAQNVLQSTVADYNSRSAQSTANIFKTSGLPDRILLPDPITTGYSVNCN